MLSASILLWSVVACAGPAAVPMDESTPSESTPSESTSSESSPAEGLVVAGARAHLLPGGHGAIYLQVSNGGPGDRLLAVETPLAAVAELHESLDDGGVMRMVARADGFAVPASGQLKLEPGGKHIMLMQIQPVVGETVPLTLRFEVASSLETTVQVLGIPGADEMDHGAMDHGSMDHGSMDQGSMDHSTMDHSTVEPAPDGTASSAESDH